MYVCMCVSHSYLSLILSLNYLHAPSLSLPPSLSLSIPFSQVSSFAHPPTVRTCLASMAPVCMKAPLSQRTLSLSLSLSPSDSENPVKKAVKEVYSSMWRYRAFSERNMFRLDHRDAAMGRLFLALISL